MCVQHLGVALFSMSIEPTHSQSRLLEDLCGEDAVRQMEALKAAELSLAARMKFWDDVLVALPE